VRPRTATVRSVAVRPPNDQMPLHLHAGARILIRMGMTAAIGGASGYAGGELLRLLLGHPQLEIGTLTAASSVGRDVTSVHPHLLDLAGRRFEPTSALADGEPDVVFLALPHGESAAVAATLPASTTVIDLGADHRLTDPAVWTRVYGGEHPGSWPLGLPELPGARAALTAATRVAVPGCYVTASTLALAPLLAAGLIEPDVVVVAASGTTGAGRSPLPNLMASEVIGDVTAYKVGSHRHRPEIAQILTAAAGTPVTVSFTPVLVPMPRGILSTCSAKLVAGPGGPPDTDTLTHALSVAYDSEPFVHVLPEGRWPRSGATLGSNAAHLAVTADPESGRAVVVCAIDNLVKGAAGQAIQCANLALGLPETAGLTAVGVAP